MILDKNKQTSDTYVNKTRVKKLSVYQRVVSGPRKKIGVALQIRTIRRSRTTHLSRGRNACVLFTLPLLSAGLVPGTLVKGVCHTHPKERRGASPTLARGAEGGELPTQWRAWWGAPRGGGGCASWWGGTSSRLPTIARRATVCRARPASKRRFWTIGEIGGKKTPNDLKVWGAVSESRILCRSSIKESSAE